MKASQVAANPHRAAALIDQLTGALEDLLRTHGDKAAIEAARLALIAATLIGS